MLPVSSIAFKWSVSSWVRSVLSFSKMSSTYLFQMDNLHCLGAVGMVFDSRSSIKNPLMMAESGSPIANPSFCLYIGPLNWKYVVLATNMSSWVMSFTVKFVRLCKVLSTLRWFYTIFSVLSIEVFLWTVILCVTQFWYCLVLLPAALSFYSASLWGLGAVLLAQLGLLIYIMNKLYVTEPILSMMGRSGEPVLWILGVP